MKILQRRLVRVAAAAVAVVGWGAVFNLVRSARAGTVLGALVLCFLVTRTEAALVNSDFLSANDGLLVTDDVENIQWLSPFFTRGQSYNNVVGGFEDLLTTHNFQFATAGTVRSMINDNFNNPTSVPIGDAAGFVSAGNFFNVFGTNDTIAGCTSGGIVVACPRTQGWAVDGSVLTGLGMIQFGTTGWMIDFTGTIAGVGNITDIQRGVWLNRDIPAVSAVPLPAALPLFLSALAGLGLMGWRRRQADA